MVYKILMYNNTGGVGAAVCSRAGSSVLTLQLPQKRILPECQEGIGDMPGGQIGQQYGGVVEVLPLLVGLCPHREGVPLGLQDSLWRAAQFGGACIGRQCLKHRGFGLYKLSFVSVVALVYQGGLALHMQSTHPLQKSRMASHQQQCCQQYHDAMCPLLHMQSYAQKIQNFFLGKIISAIAFAYLCTAHTIVYQVCAAGAMD